jgi:hypothetical protein
MASAEGPGSLSYSPSTASPGSSVAGVVKSVQSSSSSAQTGTNLFLSPNSVLRFWFSLLWFLVECPRLGLLVHL